MTSPFANALILTGPTGSGKSALALELAPLLNAEIVAADSMTLYRGMDIGTAKPTADERARVPHHLIDVRDVWEPATVAWWLEQATAIVADIEARGKTALFVGGTPFYLKALLCGLFDAPPVDVGLRKRLEAEAESDGPTPLYMKLKDVDPASAHRLHPNDVRRVVRALEVWHQTGKPLSELQRQGWWDGDSPSFRRDQCLCLTLPRDELCARIDQRVGTMFASGWINEVLRLRESVYPMSREAGMALGYREIADHLDGRRTLDETVAEIRLRTRQFAKRQLTWFKGLSGCEPVDRKLTFDRWVGRMAPGSNGP